MRKVYEYTEVKYYYDSDEERKAHVSEMEEEGWTWSGQIRETNNLHTGESNWVGIFSKRKYE